MSLTKKRAQRRWSRIEESEESETPPPIETPTPRRDFLRKAGLASLFGLGGLAAGTFLSPNVRAPVQDRWSPCSRGPQASRIRRCGRAEAKGDGSTGVPPTLPVTRFSARQRQAALEL